MTEYKTTTVAVSIHAKTDDAIYGETVTRVELENEGGGYFMTVSQEGKEPLREPLRFDLEEIELVLLAARRLISGAEGEV